MQKNTERDYRDIWKYENIFLIFLGNHIVLQNIFLIS